MLRALRLRIASCEEPKNRAWFALAALGKDLGAFWSGLRLSGSTKRLAPCTPGKGAMYRSAKEGAPEGACPGHAEKVSHVQFGKGRVTIPLARQDFPVGADHLSHHQRREVRNAAEAADPVTVPAVRHNGPPLDEVDRLGFRCVA